MFAKFALSIFTIILLISLAGCTSSMPPTLTPSEATSTYQSAASGTITGTNTEDNYQMLPMMSGKVATMKLDASADGSTQQLKKGEVMSVSLESNPSTGYAWVATISDTTVVVQMSEPEYTQPNASMTPMVGAPGTQTFFFQALDKGSATIKLAYQRSFEPGVAPVQTVTITVEVQ